MTAEGTTQRPPARRTAPACPRPEVPRRAARPGRRAPRSALRAGGGGRRAGVPRRLGAPAGLTVTALAGPAGAGGLARHPGAVHHARLDVVHADLVRVRLVTWGGREGTAAVRRSSSGGVAPAWPWVRVRAFSAASCRGSAPALAAGRALGWARAACHRRPRGNRAGATPPGAWAPPGPPEPTRRGGGLGGGGAGGQALTSWGCKLALACSPLRQLSSVS